MPSRPHNAYSLLGIPLNADNEEIQAAYEHKTAECQDEPADVLLALKVAYDCLMDPANRLLYDNRAGVQEPRKRSPEVQVMTLEEVEAEIAAEAEAKKNALARKPKRKWQPDDAARFDKARENATLDKLNAMLNRILNR